MSKKPIEFKPEKYVGKFAVVTKPKTFIKAEIHEILGVSQSNFFVRVDGVEQVSPISQYQKFWVDWFDSEDEARVEAPFIEKGRQAEEEIEDFLLENENKADVPSAKPRIEKIDKALQKPDEQADADFLLAKSLSQDERKAFRAIQTEALYQTHFFRRGPLSGTSERVVPFDSALRHSGIAPAVFTACASKLLELRLFDCLREPASLFEKMRGIEGRVYFKINLQGLAILYQLNRPTLRYATNDI